ncbi:hypothetical protein HDF09_004086 [Edaphobacter lichenicola]|uniref:Uncharacterized protein n=1 Tax=Tunturiibacter empetritectus TaxID=3069691 RepID=A0A7W8MT52_9BACT|nr:hypothetical protein [Edaphobacter lichenicola]
MSIPVQVGGEGWVGAGIHRAQGKMELVGSFRRREASCSRPPGRSME